MNILLIALGSAGDVHPFLGLAEALRGRGHKVAVATNPHSSRSFARQRSNFCRSARPTNCGPQWKAPTCGIRGGDFILIDHLLLPQLDRVYDLVEKFAARPEAVVVAPATALAARVARETLGVPLVTIHLQPTRAAERHESPLLGPLLWDDWVPRFAKRWQYHLADTLLIDRLVNRG